MNNSMLVNDTERQLVLKHRAARRKNLVEAQFVANITTDALMNSMLHISAGVKVVNDPSGLLPEGNFIKTINQHIVIGGGHNATINQSDVFTSVKFSVV